MEALVSILIPAYNAERWIAETIQSALSQTWRRTEIIVVDDGSTDRTLEIARTFESPQVRVVCQTNSGASRARNKAFSMSQGDFIQWLDSDDILAPDKISSQMASIDQSGNPTVVASGPWAHFLFRTRKARFRPSPLWASLAPQEWLLRKMEHDIHMQPATWLVSRRLTELAGPWDVRLTLDDDGEYFARVLTVSSGTVFVPEAKVFYRNAGGGSLSQVAPGKLGSQCLSSLLQVACVQSLGDSPRSRAACIKYLQKYAAMFQGHPDLLGRLSKASVALGGHLREPTVAPKYAWIAELFGLATAQRARRFYNSIKWSMARTWDWGMFRLEEALTRSKPRSR